MFQNGFVIVFPANCDIENTIFRFGAFGADRYLYYIWKRLFPDRLLRNNFLWWPRNLVSVGVRPDVRSQIQSARSPASGGAGWVTATWNLCNYGAYGLCGCSRTRERRSGATGITWHNISWPPQENLAQQPSYFNRFHI